MDLLFRPKKNKKKIKKIKQGRTEIIKNNELVELQKFQHA